MPVIARCGEEHAAPRPQRLHTFKKYCSDIQARFQARPRIPRSSSAVLRSRGSSFQHHVMASCSRRLPQSSGLPGRCFPNPTEYITNSFLSP